VSGNTSEKALKIELADITSRWKTSAPGTIDALSEWLRAELPNLGRSPEWNIPSLSGFEPEAFPSNADANIALKYFLSERWRLADAAQRRALARWVVVKWGRIQSNDTTTIRTHADAACVPQLTYRQAGIASLSKILAVANPDLFAVYDARVAAALNAVQLGSGVHQWIAFRYVGGRNVTIHGRRDDSGRLTEEGFVHMHPIASLQSRGWSVPGRGLNYLTYLAVLQECKRRLRGYKLAALEIALFANAVRVCASQMS
jgi:hypothetical protein